MYGPAGGPPRGPPPRGIIPAGPRGASSSSILPEGLIQRRVNKRTTIMQLITDIGIDLERIKISLRLFLEADKEKSGLLTYTAWCKALLVKPSPLCQKSFSLYDYDKAGRIDFHEFLIALIYLSGVDEAERVRLSFDILDVEGKGFITKAQLLKLLKATFMASDDAEVSSRADSIMEGANEVTFRGFTVMSKKFPNLMFPQYHIKNPSKKIVLFHDDSFDDFWDFYFDFGPVFLSEPAKIIIRLWYRKTTDNPSHQYSQIFLKDEIVQAFKEFDLDQNQNIDRWELNHILINIGEQVTNQEISAMIIMADMDGDGRISWDEFHSLINGFPSSQNLITGQYLVNVRNEKRQILSDFADENKLNLKSIKNSFEQYQLDESGLVDYTELCTALQIPPSKSCETIFGAFASQKTGHIDFHEFLISLSNCSGAGQDEIITFSFSIYDPHDNGGITEKQLTKIVKANYMATYNVEVERYVREAMFRVHKHGCEIISLDEIKRQLKKRHHSLFPDDTIKETDEETQKRTDANDEEIEEERFLQEALSKGKKEWRRSKIMLVGEGRAGKSALANSILGRPYENLDSTIGINEFTCSIGYAGVNFSGNGNYNQSWKELKDQKKTKDLETAVASMIHQQKTKRSSTVVNDTALDKEESLLKGGYIEGEDHSLQEGDLAMPQGTALHAVRSLTPKMEKQNDELAEKVRENLPTFSAATTTKRNEVPEVQVRDVEKKEDPFSTEFDSSLVMKYLGEQSQLESKFVISVFDFGGQSVFNVIHPFFLTQSGVYLITFNMEWLSSNAKPSIREECIRYMSFWLNSVIIHTQNQAGKVAPVAFVGTRKDIIHSPDEHLSISTLIYETFQSSVAWPHIIENPGAEGPSGKADLVFFPVNNVLGNQDPTIQHLLQYIERKIDNSDYVHVERPLSWFKVLDIFKGRNVPYLSYSEVEKIVVSCDIPKSKLPVLLKFYHEMGILMWHNEDMLRDIVVFDPIEYFVKPATIIICKHVPNKTDGIYHSLEIHKKVRKDFPEEFNEMTTHGIVSDKLLLALLEDYVANVKYIKQLMLKYGLLVPLLLNQSEDLEDIMEENTTLEVEGQWYLAPALLPEKELNLDTLRFDRTKASNSFAFVFAPPKGLRRYATISYEESRKSGFLPNGLFERLIAKSVTWSMTTSNFISRNALYNCSKNYAELEFGNQRFEMIVDYEHHLINVRLLYGNNPLVLHDRLKEQISEIISECLKSLTFLSVLKYSLPETSDRKEELNHNNENNVLLVRLKHIQSVVKKRSTLQIRRKEFYQLLTAPEAMELYEPWLNEFITFPDYDVFLSYRWGIDSQVVKGLYDRISYQTVDRTSRTIRTFLDKIRLQEGANFQSNIISSLSKSLLFVPVVSTDALQRLIHLKSTDEDNLLLEWICALELLRVGHQHSSSRVMKVLPLFFGSRVNEMILDLFQEGIINQLPELIPDKCLETAEKLLAQIGLCLSVERKQSTVKEIVSEITKFLFLKACDSKDLIHFIKFATEKLVAHLDDSLLSLPPPSSGNAHEMLVAVPTGMEQGPTPGPRPVPVPSVTVPQTPVHPPGSQQAPHQANDNPPNYDEAWEFIKPENRSKSCIEDEDQHSLLLLVRLIDKEMGVESAKDLIELSQEDLLKIAVLLKKIPQTKFKRALQLI